MDKLRTLSILAALSLASAAYAQTPQPQQDRSGTSDPSAASSPHQRDSSSMPGAENKPAETTDPSAASTPHQQETTRTADASSAGHMDHSRIIGMEVMTSADERIGTVTDVVADTATGKPGYIVISQAEPSGTTMTVVPFAALESMMKEDKLVMEKSRLQGAPKVAQGEWRDRSSTQWRSDSDRYWSGGESGAMRSAQAPDSSSSSSERSSGSTSNPDPNSTSSSSSSESQTPGTSTTPRSDTSSSSSRY